VTVPGAGRSATRTMRPDRSARLPASEAASSSSRANSGLPSLRRQIFDERVERCPEGRLAELPDGVAVERPDGDPVDQAVLPQRGDGVGRDLAVADRPDDECGEIGGELVRDGGGRVVEEVCVVDAEHQRSAGRVVPQGVAQRHEVACVASWATGQQRDERGER
jgi:hypothetical protein